MAGGNRIIALLSAALLFGLCGHAAEPVIARGMTSAAPGEQLTMQKIEESLKKIRTFEADFTQRTKYAIMKGELVCTGKNYIRRNPFGLAWKIKTPLNYAVMLTDTELLQYDAETGKNVSMGIKGSPVLSVASKVYQSLLTGNLKVFEGESETVIDQAAKTVTVTPQNTAKLGKYVKSIQFAFSHDLRYVERIQINERGGNVSRISFSNVKVNETLPADAWDLSK